MSLKLRDVIDASGRYLKMCGEETVFEVVDPRECAGNCAHSLEYYNKMWNTFYLVMKDYIVVIIQDEDTLPPWFCEEISKRYGYITRKSIIETLLPGVKCMTYWLLKFGGLDLCIWYGEKRVFTKVRYGSDYIEYEDVPFKEGDFKLRVPIKYIGRDVLSVDSVEKLPEEVSYEK